MAANGQLDVCWAHGHSRHASNAPVLTGDFRKKEDSRKHEIPPLQDQRVSSCKLLHLATLGVHQALLRQSIKRGRTSFSTKASVRPPERLRHRTGALPSPAPPRPSRGFLASPAGLLAAGCARSARR